MGKLMFLIIFLAGCGTSYDIRSDYNKFMSSCKAHGFDVERCQTDWTKQPRIVVE